MSPLEKEQKARELDACIDRSRAHLVPDTGVQLGHWVTAEEMLPFPGHIVGREKRTEGTTEPGLFSES